MSERDPLAAIRAPIATVTGAWPSMTLDAIRASFTAFLAEQGGPNDPSVAIEDFDLAGLKARRFVPKGCADKAPLLFCHGGGYQIGSIDSHASLMCRLASLCDRPVIGFDYRLAPEHRFPAAIDDCCAVYAALIAIGKVPHALIGDSAGGALALGTAMRARDTQQPLPHALVLISPWLDLTMSGASYETLAREDIFSKPDQLRLMARTYVGRQGNPADPLASPVFGDLRHLPPILVHAGGADITLDDTHHLVEKARHHGARVHAHIFPGMVHHFQMFAALPETARSLGEIAAFIKDYD